MWFLWSQLVVLPLRQLPHVARRRWPAFAAVWIRQAISCVSYLAEAYLSRPEPAVSSRSTVAILLSCHRPWNMDLMARVLLKSSCVGKIIVCNNNPDWRVRRIVKVRHEKLVLIDRPTLTMPGYRFELARQYVGPSYLAIDDDVLLRVKQIRRLSDGFAERPESPCGTQGAVLIARTRLDDVCVTRARDWPFRRATPQDATPDILNGVYMFAPAHLETYFRQCQLLAIEDQARFGNGEDIVLSHCGASRPRKIAVGPRLRCMSSGMPGIAISMRRRDAFFAERWRIFRALRSQDPKWSCRSIAGTPRS